EMEAQHGAHRQAAGDDGVATPAQMIEPSLDACVPVLPAGRQQVTLIATMAGELAAVHREALTGEALGDEFQFERGAAESVHQQEAGPPFADGEAVIAGAHALRLTRASS